ncbi:hypothetical protein GCM10022226_77710 [Sphaerisporangium flaviroseum]|uniref:Uncharacterized protein n=1 Tax=Sphaerisporangium flaviroseum TaxID=509199 RepID=A0ABP7JFW3_9ACTN
MEWGNEPVADRSRLCGLVTRVRLLEVLVGEVRQGHPDIVRGGYYAQPKKHLLRTQLGDSCPKVLR